jgi:hypothetical protein
VSRNTWLVVLAPLVVTAACAGSDDASARSPGRVASTVDTGQSPIVDTVDTGRSSTANTHRRVDSLMVLVAVVAPEVDEESGIISRLVATPQGRNPIFRGDTLYADAAALAAAIGVKTAVSLDGTRVRVDSGTLDVPGLRIRGGIYVPVRAFARALGAFTYPESDAEGITVYPRAALLYLLANRERPDEVAVLRGAKEQGLLPAR